MVVKGFFKVVGRKNSDRNLNVDSEYDQTDSEKSSVGENQGYPSPVPPMRKDVSIAITNGGLSDTLHDGGSSNNYSTQEGENSNISHFFYSLGMYYELGKVEQQAKQTVQTTSQRTMFPIAFYALLGHDEASELRREWMLNTWGSLGGEDYHPLHRAAVSVSDERKPSTDDDGWDEVWDEHNGLVYDVTFIAGAIGLELETDFYGKNVVVKGFVPNSQAKNCGLIATGDVIVGIAGVSVEGRSFEHTLEVLRRAPRPVLLEFETRRTPDQLPAGGRYRYYQGARMMARDEQESQ